MSILFCVLALAVAQPTPSKDNLVGTWKLLTYWNVSANGAKTTPYGEHPAGFLTYTREGRMSAILGARDRKPLSTGDRFTANTAERAEAFSTMLAYAGTYTLNGDKVVHHVEISTLPNFVGTDLTRSVTMQGDKIVLRTEAREVRGVMQTGELTWQRVP